MLPACVKAPVWYITLSHYITVHIAITGQDTLPGVPSPASVHSGPSFGAIMSFCDLYTACFYCLCLFTSIFVTNIYIYLLVHKYIWWDYPKNIYTICKYVKYQIIHHFNFEYVYHHVHTNIKYGISTSFIPFRTVSYKFKVSQVPETTKEKKTNKSNFLENVFDIKILSSTKILLLMNWTFILPKEKSSFLFPTLLSYVIFWDQRTNSWKWIMCADGQYTAAVLRQPICLIGNTILLSALSI